MRAALLGSLDLLLSRLDDEPCAAVVVAKIGRELAMGDGYTVAAVMGRALRHVGYDPTAGVSVTACERDGSWVRVSVGSEGWCVSIGDGIGASHVVAPGSGPVRRVVKVSLAEVSSRDHCTPGARS